MPLVVHHNPMRGGRRFVTFGSFVTNGASAPTTVGGDIKSVQRLVDAGAKPFFRVRFVEPFPLGRGSSTTTLGWKNPDVMVLNLVVERGDVTPNPVLALRDDELDVVVKSADVPTDTAGVRVDLALSYQG